jgi:hypothetical protein
MALLTNGCAGAIASMSCLAELGMEMVSRVTDAGKATQPMPNHKARNCSSRIYAHYTRCRAADHHALLRTQVHPPPQLQLRTPYN